MESVLNDNIMKVWAKFVVSSVIGVVLNTIYSVIDGMFVGQGVGEIGLASINIVWPAITVIIGIGLMIGIGSSSIIAIHIGKNDKENAEKTLATSIKSILLIGGLVMILGLVFREQILKLLGAKDEVLPMAREYFTVLYLITIPYMFSNALNPMVRTDGNPSLSMIMIGIGAVLNIILDWLFVIKLGFGVAGAAAATGASIFISTLVPLYYFTKGKANIKLKKIYFKIDKSILVEILKIGFV
ncbi:MAG: MATE family efflux transporter, partial [Paraclostridium sp.]